MKVRMLSIITGSYIIFWGPLFAVTVWHWSWGWEEAKKSLAHEVFSFLAPTGALYLTTLTGALYLTMRSC